MVEKQIKKAINTKFPFKSFQKDLTAAGDVPPEERLKKLIYERFGQFAGDLQIAINPTEINIKWYVPEINNKAEFFNKKAMEYARNKAFDKAIASWQEAVLLNNNDPDYHNNLSAAFLQLNKFQEAAECLEKVIKVYPLYPTAIIRLGGLYFKLRKFELAEKYLQLSTFPDPENPYTCLNLGWIYTIQRSFTKAIEQFQRAQQLIPQDARPYSGLAKIYSVQGDVERANSYFHKVIELDKTGELASYARRAIVKKPVPKGVTLTEPVKTFSAESVPVIPLPPGANPEDFFSEGYVAYIAGDYLKAETLYERYLQYKPKDATVWCTLGEVRIRAQKVEPAIAAIKNALALEEKGLFYKELGVAHDLNQQPDEALSAVQKAIKAGKKDSTVYLIGGKSHLKLQRFQEAQEMLEEAVKLNSNNFMAHFQLARTLAHLKNFPEAINHLEIIKAIRVETPLKQAVDQMLTQLTNRKTE